MDEEEVSEKDDLIAEEREWHCRDAMEEDEQQDAAQKDPLNTVHCLGYSARLC